MKVNFPNLDENECSIDEFCLYCQKLDLDKVSQFIKSHRSLLDLKDSKLGLTPLSHAVLCGSVELTSILLESGADPNITNQMGETPLHQAADNSEYCLAKKLLDYKADPNLKTHEGETALHQAIYRGDDKIVKLLLNHNANPNEKNFISGKTPLHISAEFSQIECANLLLSFKADVRLKDKNGQKPIDLARDEEIVENLIEYENEIKYEEGISLFNIPEASPGEEDKSTVFSFNCTPKVNNYHISLSIPPLFRQRTSTQISSLDIIRTEPNGIKSKTTSASSSMFDGNDQTEKLDSFKLENNSLYKFLKRLDLAEYLNLFEKSGFDDLTSLIQQMKTPLPITLEILTNIGIRKHGHKARILIKLEIEAGIQQKFLTEISMLLDSTKNTQNLYMMPKSRLGYKLED